MGQQIGTEFSLLRRVFGCTLPFMSLACQVGLYSLIRDLLEGDWRRGPGSNRRIKVLQTSPLPLGYRAFW